MGALGMLLRALLLVLGVLLIAAGGLWTLQGLGIVMWPAESFMLADSRWAYYGAATLGLGILLAWVALRWRRR